MTSLGRVRLLFLCAGLVSACGRADVAALGGGVPQLTIEVPEVGVVDVPSLDAGTLDTGVQIQDAENLDAMIPFDGGLALDAVGPPDVAGDAFVPDLSFPDAFVPPDSGVVFDATSPDGFVFPDLGLRDANTPPDSGVVIPDVFVFPDAIAFDVLPPFDGGRPDAFVFPDFGVVDVGVPLDVGVPFDVGIPFDVGVPDGGIQFDAFVPDLGLPDVGGPCVNVDCSHLNDSCNVGVCDIVTGQCLALPFPDGVPCDDGTTCTQGDQCQAGQCQGVLTMPRGDTCADAIPLAPSVGRQTVPGDTSCGTATQDPGCSAPRGKDIFYEFAITDGPRRVVAELQNAAFDTVMYARSQCVDPATELVCDDDGGVGFASRFDQQFDAGNYSLAVDGFAASEGVYSLVFDIDPQNTCANPSVLEFPASGTVTTVEGVTIGANNTFTARCAAQANSPDHVYVMDVPRRTTIVLETVQPPNGRYDTALHLMDATCVAGAGTRIACDDDGGASTFSRIQETLDPGRYHVVVDGFGSNSAGRYVLTLAELGTVTTTVAFPTAQDVRLTQQGNLLSQAGDFVEGVRMPGVASVSRVSIDLAIDPNALSCGVAEVLMLINGQPVTTFFVAPGDSRVTRMALVPQVTGPVYSLRLQLNRSVPPGCGGFDFSNTNSLVTLGN